MSIKQSCKKNITLIKSVIKNKRNITLLLILFSINFFIHLFILFQDKYAVGVDGYYYAAQVRFFQKHLCFASPDISLTLYYLAGFSYLGNDIVVTNKIAISLLASLLIIPAFLLGKRIYSTQNGLFYAGLITSSSSLTYFMYEYVKNLGGIFVFLFFLNQLFAWKEKESRANIIKLFFVFFLVLITHKLMAALAVVCLLGSFIFQYKHKLRFIIIFLFSFFGIVVVLGLFVPNILHVYDLQRLYKLFSVIPDSGFYYSLKYGNPSLLFIIELFVLAFSPLFFIYQKQKILKQNRFPFYIMILLFALFNFPFFHFSINDISFRLYLLTFLSSLFFLAVFICSLFKKRQWIIIIILITLIPFKYITMDQLRNMRNTDYVLYEALLPLIDLPVDSLLVVHQGFDYFYTYHTKKRAFHYLPEYKHAKRPQYRLAYAVRPELFEKGLGKESYKQKVTMLPGFYYLMKEKTWQYFLSNIGRDDKKGILNWRNPHSYRHAYMLRNQKFRKKNN